MLKPTDCKPVLAKIVHTSCLGESTWYEVVYYSDVGESHCWRSYSGSNTFMDGEKVVDWAYADEALKGASKCLK